MLELFQAQKLHSCLLKKGVSGLLLTGLQTGDYKEKRQWKMDLDFECRKEKKFCAFSRLPVGKILLHIENSISLMVQIKT